MAPAKKSLTAFVKESRATRGRICSTCNLPVVDQINQAKLDGTATVSEMVEWLSAIGLDSTSSRLNYHFNNGHHVDTDAS